MSKGVARVWRGCLYGLYGLSALLSAACAGSGDGAPALHVEAILDGQPAPNWSGVVSITHRDRGDVCSGAAIAPRLVLTAKHCVFRSTSNGDELLAPDAFRVSFGPDEEHFELRFTEAVSWVGMPAELDVLAAVDAGEDVALLHLEEDAPEGVALLTVRSNYLPMDGDLVTILGFGVSVLATGKAGVRLWGEAQVEGFDRDSGVLQLEGASACFGDSGGPVVLKGENALVAVVGRVGADDAGPASFCDASVTFASSLANRRVRALLLEACAAAGGCGPRAQIADAAVETRGGSAMIDSGPGIRDAGLDAAVVETAAASDGSVARGDGGAGPGGSRAGCGCAAVGEPAAGRQPMAWTLLTLLALSCMSRRGMRRRASGRQGSCASVAGGERQVDAG